MRFGVQNRDVVEDTFRIELFDDVDGELHSVANGYINSSIHQSSLSRYPYDNYKLKSVISIYFIVRVFRFSIVINV